MAGAAELAIVIRARDQASRTMGGIGKAGDRMGAAVKAGAMVGVVGLVALSAAALKFASDFDNAYITIRRGTGETGDALEGLKHDFRETFRGVPDAMADVATATAELNTRLNLTGEPLQQMSRQFLDLARITGTDVATAIAAGTRVFGDWSIATDRQSAALDHAFKVSQTTGIGVDSLMEKVVQFGAPLRQFGFGFENATVLLGKWEKEGVNTEAILGALKIGVSNFARQNIDAVTGLQDFIAELNELGPGAEATARAIEIFGSRAGPDMAAAVTEGRFALEDLMAIIEGSEETIAGVAAETLTWKDKLRILRNEVLVQLEPALVSLTEKLEILADKAVPAIIGGVALLSGEFDNLDRAASDAAIGVVVALRNMMAAVDEYVPILGDFYAGIQGVKQILEGDLFNPNLPPSAIDNLDALIDRMHRAQDAAVDLRSFMGLGVPPGAGGGLVPGPGAGPGGGGGAGSLATGLGAGLDDVEASLADILRYTEAIAQHEQEAALKAQETRLGAARARADILKFLLDQEEVLAASTEEAERLHRVIATDISGSVGALSETFDLGADQVREMARQFGFIPSEADQLNATLTDIFDGFQVTIPQVREFALALQNAADDAKRTADELERAAESTRFAQSARGLVGPGSSPGQIQAVLDIIRQQREGTLFDQSAQAAGVTVTQHITVKSPTPADIAHEMEMASILLGQQLKTELG